MDEDFTEEEYEVSRILVDMSDLMLEKDLENIVLPPRRPPPPRQPFLVRWGTKKILVCERTRRGSTIPPPPTPSPNLPTTPSSSQNPLPPLQNKSQQRQLGEEVNNKVDATTSPNTPFCFSTFNESDDKPSHTHRRKNFSKRDREKFLETVKGLTGCRESLRKEVENARSYYNQLLAVNRALKAKKQKVESTSADCNKKEEPNLEVNKRLNLGLNSSVQTCQIASMESPISPYRHNNGQEVQVRPTPNLFSSCSGLGKLNHMGPLEIPDLNVPTKVGALSGVASFQPLDYGGVFADKNRARSAEARRIRKMKIQQKLDLKSKSKGALQFPGLN